jgi:predicted transcriptional regulator with HTH domain
MIDSLFGSKTRVKLLYLFLNNPGRAFYVREITRRVDEQINSVRRELANMLSVGVIKSDGIDNKLYYEVDQSYRYYKPLQQIFSEQSGDTANTAGELQSSTDWTKRLRKLTGVQIVVLAGGFVSGSRSRVDVLIVGIPPKTQIKRFIADLEEDEHRSVHYTVIPFDEFYYRLSMKDRFIAEIVEGKHRVVLDNKNVISAVKAVKE